MMAEQTLLMKTDCEAQVQQQQQQQRFPAIFHFTVSHCRVYKSTLLDPDESISRLTHFSSSVFLFPSPDDIPKCVCAAPLIRKGAADLFQSDALSTFQYI